MPSASRARKSLLSFRESFGRLVLAAAISCVAVSLRAETFHVAHQGGPGGDGSLEHPFASIEAALGAVRGGDVIALHSGNYGFLKLANARFEAPVTITSAKGERARFSRIAVVHSRNIVFDNLDVWPDAPDPEAGALVRAMANAQDIEFRNLDVRSVEDAARYRTWNKQQWLAVKVSGILAQGPNNVVQGNRVIGAYHALAISGANGKLLDNQVFGFSGDAMRALGDNSVVRGNRVQDCVQIDQNHADGFQTWSRGANGAANQGTVKGLTVEENIIREWVGVYDNPLTCSLQGIFMGGYLEDLTVKNNIVMVSAWHGITGYGITRGAILNNTLVNSRGPNPKAPWIGVWGYKKRGSTDVIVANNIAPFYNVNVPGNPMAPEFRNVKLPFANRQLRAPYAGDFRLKADSSLIDRANPLLAPARDVFGQTRPLGRGPDIGAVETQ